MCPAGRSVVYATIGPAGTKLSDHFGLMAEIEIRDSLSLNR